MAGLIKKTFSKITSKQVLVTTLALAVFLTDNANFTSASSFENNTLSSAGGKKNKLRLPSNVAAKPTVDFDCLHSQDKIEINTEFETVRLLGANCADKINVVNTKLKNTLLTFPTDKKTYSSEFAYLARGENNFVITAGKKKIKVKIFRF